MPKPPRGYGIVLCQGLDVVSVPGQLSLNGVFQRLHFRHFPTPPYPFTAYVALLGGDGEGMMELACMRLQGEEVVYTHQHWAAFANPEALAFVEIKVRQCRFPVPGRYRLALRFDGREIAEGFLDVLKKVTP